MPTLCPKLKKGYLGEKASGQSIKAVQHPYFFFFRMVPKRNLILCPRLQNSCFRLQISFYAIFWPEAFSPKKPFFSFGYKVGTPFGHPINILSILNNFYCNCMQLFDLRPPSAQNTFFIFGHKIGTPFGLPIDPFSSQLKECLRPSFHTIPPPLPNTQIDLHNLTTQPDLKNCLKKLRQERLVHRGPVGLLVASK